MRVARDQAEKLRFWFNRHQVQHPEGQVFVYPQKPVGSYPAHRKIVALLCIVVLGVAIAIHGLYRNFQERYRSNMAALENTKESLERDVATLVSQMHALYIEVQSTQKTKDVLEKELSQMSLSNADLLGKVNLLQSDYDQMRQAFVQTQHELSAAQDDKERLQQQVDDEVVILRKKVDALQQAMAQELVPSEGDPRMSGKILEVNSDLGFAVIDRGIRQGVRSGQEYPVWRGLSRVGTVRVVEVRDNVSAAEIEGSYTRLQKGDEVRAR